MESDWTDGAIANAPAPGRCRYAASALAARRTGTRGDPCVDEAVRETGNCGTALLPNLRLAAGRREAIHGQPIAAAPGLTMRVEDGRNAGRVKSQPSCPVRRRPLLVPVDRACDRGAREGHRRRRIYFLLLSLPLLSPSPPSCPLHSLTCTASPSRTTLATTYLTR